MGSGGALWGSQRTAERPWGPAEHPSAPPAPPGHAAPGPCFWDISPGSCCFKHPWMGREAGDTRRGAGGSPRCRVATARPTRPPPEGVGSSREHRGRPRGAAAAQPPPPDFPDSSGRSHKQNARPHCKQNQFAAPSVNNRSGVTSAPEPGPGVKGENVPKLDLHSRIALRGGGGQKAAT